jgi:DNA replication protein DnaC
MVEDYYKNDWKKRASELESKELLGKKQKENLKDMIDSPDEENFILAEELLRLKVSEALVEGLNDGQLKAFLEIVDFFRNPQEDAVVLKGYAGTGKTFLVKRVIEYITTSYSNRKIAITAPTNKAVHVLSRNSPFADNSAIFEEYNQPKSKIVFSTIHKLLGLKEEITNTGEQNFVAGKKTDLDQYMYLIIDEVSMLNDDLFDQVMKFSDKIRIILMGDPAQIPPINKEHCSPFREVCPYNLRKLELTEIMRQKTGNPIVDASMTLRSNLHEQLPLGSPENLTKLDAEGNGIKRIHAKDERPMVRQTIDKYFNDPKAKSNGEFIKIIAWRNKSVEYLNDVVRQCLYGEDKKVWNVGDKIVANKPLFRRDKSNWNGYQYIIKGHTSDEFVIKKIEKVYREFSEGFKTSPTINFEGNYWKLTVSPEKYASEEMTGPENDKVIYVLHNDSIDEFNEILIELNGIAKNSYNKDSWVMYFNMLKWSDNVMHNYAITAHKAQGSTYENVILIEEDLDRNKKIVERNRIKYTAYTRAKNKLFILK